MGTIIAMLVWMGHAHGGPAAIQGFETIEACERARPAVEARFSALTWPASSVRTGCISLPTR